MRGQRAARTLGISFKKLIQVAFARVANRLDPREDASVQAHLSTEVNN